MPWRGPRGRGSAIGTADSLPRAWRDVRSRRNSASAAGAGVRRVTKSGEEPGRGVETQVAVRAILDSSWAWPVCPLLPAGCAALLVFYSYAVSPYLLAVGATGRATDPRRTAAPQDLGDPVSDDPRFARKNVWAAAKLRAIHEAARCHFTFT